MYEDYENAVYERLKGRITSAAVEIFPDKPDSFVMSHPVGVILVGYARGVYETPHSTPMTHQFGKIEIDVVFKFRHLRDHQGIYTYMTQTREALLGFEVITKRKMYMVREEMLDYDSEKGIWTWAQTWAFTNTISQI